ncbi:MAG: polymer-forming cytoskeletal protein [Oscillospiraceae bacterium]|nr:polymer-forming cytoskeletal protein [Oscillospiraceae bacterium]
MSKKENLSQAMYEMFGVGKEPAAEKAAPKAAPASKAPELEADLLEEIRKEVAAEVKAEVKAAPAPAPAPVEENVPVTYLASGVTLEGKLTAKGDVEIAGQFKGEIVTEGKVIVRSLVQSNISAGSLNVMGGGVVGDVNIKESVLLSSGTCLKGNVFAGDLVCSGAVKGDVEVKGNLALDINASVEGNITTGTMTMAQGAVISGAVTMGAKKA